MKEEICMSKFDYMNFSDGISDIEFVANAKTYTKEQTIELCLAKTIGDLTLNFAMETY